MNDNSAVFYRRYRPQSFDDLVGQDKVVELLRSSLNSGKLSHAYLLVGPRGVGKTSTARILAKMVNCQGKNPPCNACEICQSITDGSNLDLIEIDAASNRGIDDIRELKERIKLSPSSLKKKVYIIDEVHMLTTEAFNALLKTLEEPPSHVLFILATTEASKIPQTILSRVTRLDFQAATPENMVKVLQKVVEREKIKIEPEALEFLAKKADGSFRDGVKLLDQFSSLEKITLKEIEGLSGGFALGLVSKLSEKDTRGALELISKEISVGMNIKEVIAGVMEIFRECLMVKHLSQSSKLIDLANKFSSEELIKDLEYFQKAYEALKSSPIPSLPLEVAVIESTNLKVASGSLKVNIEAKSKVEEANPSSNHQDQVSSLQIPSSKIENEVVDDSKDMGVLKDKWDYILETIKLDNFSLEALLRSVKLSEVEGEIVMIKVPYTFHQRILETPRNRELLESVLSDVLGRSVRVGTILDLKPVRVEELQNVELAADDEIIRVAAEIFSSES